MELFILKKKSNRVNECTRKTKSCLFDARPKKESQCTGNRHSADQVRLNDKVECEQIYPQLSAPLLCAFFWVWNLQPHLICLGTISPLGPSSKVISSVKLSPSFLLQNTPCFQFCFQASAADIMFGMCLFPSLVERRDLVLFIFSQQM